VDASTPAYRTFLRRKAAKMIADLLQETSNVIKLKGETSFISGKPTGKPRVVANELGLQYSYFT